MCDYREIVLPKVRVLAQEVKSLSMSEVIKSQRKAAVLAPSVLA